MNYILMLIVIFLGGGIGLYLDLYRNVKEPSVYWFWGALTGVFGMIVGLWPLIGD